MRVGLWCGLAVLASACGPPGDTDALLLLDADARAAGLTLSVGGWSGSPRLPISAHEHEPVLLAGPFGSRALPVRPGQLGLVVGQAGSVDWLQPGADVDGDALEFSGDEAAVSAVAATLGASVTTAGAGRWTLRAPEVLAQSAWLQPGGGVRQAAPVFMLAPRLVDAGAFATLKPAATRVVLLGEVPAWVGVYTSERETLVLDASGGFTLSAGCDVTVGTFRVDGGVLVLVPEQGAPRAVRIEGDALEGFEVLEVTR